ncbi:hypothetical protein C343_03335 [Cryptococcus neoformans C23]|nr:hypothetical protein C347_03398 [Cryptococcus neoformans var. grubii AD2-60a]OWZ43365.1 hypothetical protein C353_03238 [Cryptococcus neoformans var. grubii AD1-83a]OWZ43910.1 hypothetical protein C343_03335 [Cryptococcus neoformans var. grubii C23]OXC84643.1 hypothetical protein C344_03095 [Cryptococcus neoformans var. grubii AD1-7a]OXG31476.1 hypothetical protein C360_04689 [Cryptococcus neoformans var. grubii Bt15]OXG59951.1 hypothetical protein C354_03174 [Cryptococcus neoformans var. g
MMNSLQRIKQAFDNHGSQDNGKISSLAPYGVYVDPFYASPATTVRLSWSSEDYRASPAGFQLNTPPRRPYSHRKSYSSPPGSQTSPTAPLLPYSRLPDLISTRSTGAYQNYTVTRSHPSGYELVDEPISSPFNISVLSPTETATSIPETPLLTPTTDAPFFAPLNVDRVRSIVEQAKETNAGVAPGTSKDTSLHFKNQPFTVPEITITDDNKPGTQQSIYALNDFGWLLDYIGIDRPLSHFPPSVSTKASLDPSRVKAVELFIKSARNTLARSGSKMGIDNPRLTTADGVHIIDKLKELEQFFHQGGVICTDGETALRDDTTYDKLSPHVSPLDVPVSMFDNTICMSATLSSQTREKYIQSTYANWATSSPQYEAERDITEKGETRCIENEDEFVEILLDSNKISAEWSIVDETTIANDSNDTIAFSESYERLVKRPRPPVPVQSIHVSQWPRVFDSQYLSRPTGWKPYQMEVAPAPHSAESDVAREPPRPALRQSPLPTICFILGFFMPFIWIIGGWFISPSKPRPKPAFIDFETGVSFVLPSTDVEETKHPWYTHSHPMIRACRYAVVAGTPSITLMAITFIIMFTVVH